METEYTQTLVEENFYKFPKTPHLYGSDVVDDDQIISLAQLKNAFGTSKELKLVIQEKVDGSNVSVHFVEEWNPIVQKRNGILKNNEKDQYNVFRAWCYDHVEILWEILNDRYCLFGEWLWCRHNIYYDSLPDYLIVFDAFDKKTNEFISSQRLKALVGDKLMIVPTWYEGEIKSDADTFIQSLM